MFIIDLKTALDEADILQVSLYLYQIEDINAPLPCLDKDVLIHYLAKNGYADILRLVLECRQDAYVDTVDEHLWTALHHASSHEEYECVKILIEHGANVNRTSKYGGTVLHHVCQNRNPSSAKYIQFLMEQGADPNFPDYYGWSPLHRVCNLGYSESISALLSGGAYVNAQTRQGWTPLFIAVRFGKLECARLVLEAGADLHLGKEHGLVLLNEHISESMRELVQMYTK